MTDRALRVRVQVDSRAAAQGLRGVSRAVQTSNRQRRSDADATRRSVEREEQNLSRAVQRMQQRELRELRRNERAKREERSRTTREAERSERQLARMVRERQRDARGRFVGGGGGGGGGGRGGGLRRLGGALYGVGTTAANRVQGYQATLGVPSQSEMIANFIGQQQGLIRTAAQAGLSADQRAALERRIGDVALATNANPTDLYSSLSMAQGRFASDTFPALEVFGRHLEEIARASQAAGGSAEDWIGAVGEFNRQLGVTEEQFPELIGALVQASRNGSIEAGDVAANFAPLLSTYRNVRGDAGTGIQGAREFLAVAESLGAGGKGAEGTRTALENLFGAFGNSRTRRGIERQLGRDVFDRSGQLNIPLAEFLDRASQNERFGTPSGLEAAGFTDRQAREAMVILLTRMRETGANEVANLQGVNAEEGNRFVNDTVGALMNSTSGRAIHERVNAQVNFQRNGEQLVQMMVDLTGPVTDLQTRFPQLAEAAGFTSEAVRDVGETFVALKLLGFGGAAGGTTAAAGGAATSAGGGLLAGAAGSGGLAGFFGTSVGAASTGAIGLTALLGGVLGVGAGLGIGELAVPDAFASATGGGVRGRNWFENGQGQTLFEQWKNIAQPFNTAVGRDVLPTGQAPAQPAITRDDMQVAVSTALRNEVLNVRSVDPPFRDVSARRNQSPLQRTGD